MDKELIKQQETTNDGRSVFLYYHTMIGFYVAFGRSAYYADMAASPILSYSEEMQMPVALLNRRRVLDVRQSMIMVSHTVDETYHFHTKQVIGNADYEKWKQNVLKHYNTKLKV